MADILTCEERIRQIEDATTIVNAQIAYLQKLQSEESNAIDTGRYHADMNEYFERALQNSGTQNTSNPLFTGSAADWTLGANWSYGSDKVTHSAGSDATLSQVVGDQQIPIISGGLYRVTMIIVDYSAGSIRMELGGGSGSGTFGDLNSIRANLGDFQSADGNFVQHLYCFGGTSIIAQPTTDFAGAVTQIGIKQIRGVAGAAGQALAELGNMNWIYGEQVVIAPTEGYEFCIVDVIGGNHLTASGSSIPYAGFVAGDIVEIIGAGDSDNDGIREIDTVGGGGANLLFTTDLDGGDTSEDTTIRVILRQR